MLGGGFGRGRRRLANLNGKLRQRLGDCGGFGQDELRRGAATSQLDLGRAGSRLRLDELRDLARRVGLHERGELIGWDGDDGDLLSGF